MALRKSIKTTLAGQEKVSAKDVTAKELGEVLAVAAYQGMQALVEHLKAFPPQRDHSEVLNTLQPQLETLCFTLFAYLAARLKHYHGDMDKAFSVECPMVQRALELLKQGTGRTEKPRFVIKGLQLWVLRSTEYLEILWGNNDLLRDLQLQDASALADAVRVSSLSQTAVQHACGLPQLPGMQDSAVPMFFRYFKDTWELVPSELEMVRFV
jgi:hypothetical protein